MTKDTSDATLHKGIICIMILSIGFGLGMYAAGNWSARYDECAAELDTCYNATVDLSQLSTECMMRYYELSWELEKDSYELDSWAWWNRSEDG